MRAISIKSFAGVGKPLRRSEIRETGSFMALTNTGLRYQVLRWTRVVSVTFANQPELSTDADSWYRTLAGQLVRTLDDHRFEIVASGVRLERVHADAFFHPSQEPSAAPSVDLSM